jgi:hypothetical protein
MNKPVILGEGYKIQPTPQNNLEYATLAASKLGLESSESFGILAELFQTALDHGRFVGEGENLTWCLGIIRTFESATDIDTKGIARQIRHAMEHDLSR